MILFWVAIRSSNNDINLDILYCSFCVGKNTFVFFKSANGGIFLIAEPLLYILENESIIDEKTLIKIFLSIRVALIRTLIKA